MSERPAGVKVGDRVRITTVHTGTITRIDDDSFVLETQPGRPMQGSFHGDGEMTWKVQRPEPPDGAVVRIGARGPIFDRDDSQCGGALGDVRWLGFGPDAKPLRLTWAELCKLGTPIELVPREDEPLATDAERLAAGWLDPATADKLYDRLAQIDDEWLAASCDHRDPESVDLWRGTPCLTCVAERDEARARLIEVSNYRLAQLRRFAAEQPVITAARAWRAAMKLAEAAMANDSTWKLSPVSAVLADAIDALDADTETPPC